MTKTKLENKMETLAEILKAQNTLKVQADNLKAEIMKEMEKQETTKLVSSSISIAYVSGSDKVTFDSKTFKTAHPKLYKEFVKVSPSAAYIKATLKA